MPIHVHLDSSEELTGELVGITETDGRVIVELSSGTLSCPGGTVEPEQLQEERTGMNGQSQGTFPTDHTASPLAIAVDTQ
jgi:hypothetical protein